ncbi:hypothetical protein H4R34_000460 [Dimargaris verticillata]|uniref:Uncharacterized protein n=1 Tax=Dimargaris verticillata TaxID=2761393 RepID=A0A9W8B745_9FUNG|nr:hypothetical protein H4R34_000460 [Dimargaris verticillata]
MARSATAYSAFSTSMSPGSYTDRHYRISAADDSAQATTEANTEAIQAIISNMRTGGLNMSESMSINIPVEVHQPSPPQARPMSFSTTRPSSPPQVTRQAPVNNSDFYERFSRFPIPPKAPKTEKVTKVTPTPARPQSARPPAMTHRSFSYTLGPDGIPRFDDELPWPDATTPQSVAESQSQTTRASSPSPPVRRQSVSQVSRTPQAHQNPAQDTKAGEDWTLLFSKHRQRVKVPRVPDSRGY